MTTPETDYQVEANDKPIDAFNMIMQSVADRIEAIETWRKANDALETDQEEIVAAILASLQDQLDAISLSFVEAQDAIDQVLNGEAQDSARLGAQLPAFYRSADNLNTGTLDPDRLPNIPDAKLPNIPAVKLPNIPAAKLPAPLDDLEADVVEFLTSADYAAMRANMEVGSGSPVGSVTEYEGVLFPGHILYREGGSYDTTVYPELLAFFQEAKANGGFPSLTETDIANGVFPDHRGYSPRTSGGAFGPAAGELEEDAIQGHGHNIEGHERHVSFTSTGDTVSNVAGTVKVLEIKARDLISDGVNGTPRIAEETRVKSFGVRWQIKAYGAIVNEGTADLVAIETAQAQMLRKDAQTLNDTEQAQVAANLGLPFSKSYPPVGYPDVEHDIVSGGALTIAHGLGVPPKIIQACLVCKTAEKGYSVGSIIPATYNTSSAESSRFGIALDMSSSSEITARYGDASSVFLVTQKDDGTTGTLTNAKWKLMIRAFA